MDTSDVVISEVISHQCPKCETVSSQTELQQCGYRCPNCSFELAYLDTAPNGTLRGIFGWLRSVGDIIQNRYLVKEVLGKGGFGTTYLVEDLKLNGKRRAIKEIPELLFDEYETNLLSRLHHPAIPDIIDRIVANGMVYLVLEFGGTRTIGSERKKLGGRIPFALLVPWLQQLCDVLSYLHSQIPPVIHRDLKPDNILLDENDRIMLIDFGIAKEIQPSNLTRMLGRAISPGFSSPEQCMGTGTDERSDIYSFAATVYYLLTGQILPPADALLAGKPIPALSQFIPEEIPPSFEKSLLRALSLNSNQRQQSIKEIKEIIDALETGRNVSPKTVLAGDYSEPSIRSVISAASIKIHTKPSENLVKQKSKHRHWQYWVATTLSVLLLAAGLGIYLRQPTETTEKTEKPEMAQSENQQPTGLIQPLSTQMEKPPVNLPPKNSEENSPSVEPQPSSLPAIKSSSAPDISVEELLREHRKQLTTEPTTVPVPTPPTSPEPPVEEAKVNVNPEPQEEPKPEKPKKAEKPIKASPKKSTPPTRSVSKPPVKEVTKKQSEPEWHMTFGKGVKID